jgi:endo-cleaving rubber dioxygenase
MARLRFRVALVANAQIEDRKIYNTRMHSQSNTGYEFTDVLTDAERAAPIEYLKTP